MQEPPVVEEATAEEERPVYEEAAVAAEPEPVAEEPAASAYASPDVETVQEDGITEEAGGSVFQDDSAINDVPAPEEEEAVQAREEEITVDLPPEQAMPEEVDELPLRESEGTRNSLEPSSPSPPLSSRGSTLTSCDTSGAFLVYTTTLMGAVGGVCESQT